MIFNIGESTDKVYAGDLVTECEFLFYIPMSQWEPHELMFYDVRFQCFRRCRWEKHKDNKTFLHGYKCADRISKLL